MNKSYIEKDKELVPFLLAASNNFLLRFERHFVKNGIVYWEFTPAKEAERLIEKLLRKSEPHIPVKDVFEAINFFWRTVENEKRREKK
ncbi:hypothetical protein GF360_00955 [candidate division WWE3 bacterium]|nr:hypothetical protein [candidate division WWE3 bacterium]